MKRVTMTGGVKVSRYCATPRTGDIGCEGRVSHAFSCHCRAPVCCVGGAVAYDGSNTPLPGTTEIGVVMRPVFGLSKEVYAELPSDAYRAYNRPAAGVPAAWPGSDAGTIPAQVRLPVVS